MKQVKAVQIQNRLFLQAHGLVLGFFRADHFVRAFHTMTPRILEEIKAYETEILGKHRASILTSFFVFVANLAKR